MFIAVAAATLFSGAAAAGQYNDHKKDQMSILNGTMKSTPAEPYVYSGAERDNRDDLVYNIESVVPASPHVPYTYLDDDRDNREDMLNTSS